MNLWYTLWDLLPFEMLHWDFMKNALLALLLLAGAARAAFADRDAIRHADAVALMADLGLISGYEDGSFRPRNNIRRAEAAKLAAIIIGGGEAQATFSDVEKNLWAAGYIGL